MKYRPVLKNVIVEPLEADKVTSTGILLKVSIEPDKGLVHGVGPLVTQVAEGDKVFLDWNHATKLDGEDLYVISEDHIVFVYEDE